MVIRSRLEGVIPGSQPQHLLCPNRVPSLCGVISTIQHHFTRMWPLPLGQSVMAWLRPGTTGRRVRRPGYRTDRGPHSWLVESDLLRNSKCDPESEDLLTSCSLDASFTSLVSSLCSPVNQQSFCPPDSNIPNPS